MRELIPQFEKECIAPNIVNKLSLYEMQCLGLTGRSAIMNVLNMGMKDHMS